MTKKKEICGLVLEQYLLGELSIKEREQVREKAAGDPAITRALKEIDFGREAPPSPTAMNLSLQKETP